MREGRDVQRAQVGTLTGSVPRLVLLRATGAAASVGYGLLLADLLDPVDMGRFASAVSATLILATVSKCGLDAYLMRHAAQHPESAGRLALRCTAVAGAVGACLWLVYLATGTQLHAATGWVLGVFLLAIPFLAMSYVLGGLLKSGNAPGAAIFVETGGWQAAMCVCAIGMHLAGSDSLAVVAVAFAGAAVLLFGFALGAAARIVDTPFCRSATRFDLVRVRETAQLAALSVAHVAMRWSDLLWLALWLDAETVAIYAICTRLAGGVAFVDHAVNAVAAPRFARRHGSGKMRLLRTELRRAVVVSAACGALAAGALMLVGPMILGFLGAPYAGSVGVLRIAAGLAAVHVALVPIGHLAAMSGCAADHLKATCTLLTLQQLVYLLLIPQFGMAGALVGFALPQALANLLTLALLRHNSRKPVCEGGDRPNARGRTGRTGLENLWKE